MEQCELYLDGEPLGDHAGGYLPFDPSRRSGRPGQHHELVIRVVNPFGFFDRQPVYSDPAAMAAGVAALGDALTGVPGGKQTWYTATSGLVRGVTLGDARRPPRAAARGRRTCGRAAT